MLSTINIYLMNILKLQGIFTHLCPFNKAYGFIEGFLFTFFVQIYSEDCLIFLFSWQALK